MAVASVILGVTALALPFAAAAYALGFCFALSAIILGAMASERIRRAGEKGARIARAGAFIGCAAAALALLVGGAVQCPREGGC